MKPSQLRKRTANIEGYIENWLDHYDTACGLEQAGQLLKTAIIQMGQLQDKVNNQARVIQDMEVNYKSMKAEYDHVVGRAMKIINDYKSVCEKAVELAERNMADGAKNEEDA